MKSKRQLAQLRHWRVRKKVSGTKERPRMAVFFSNENIHVQFIDDTVGKTLAATSTLSSRPTSPVTVAKTASCSIPFGPEVSGQFHRLGEALAGSDPGLVGWSVWRRQGKYRRGDGERSTVL